MVRAAPVPEFVAVTVAPCTTAPEGSVTTPAIEPVPAWPAATMHKANKTTQFNRTLILRMYFLQGITCSGASWHSSFRDDLEKAISWPFLSADVGKM